MKTEYLTLDNVTPLSRVPEGSEIHFIGVCGVAMAPLAIELSSRGFKVSGSDKQFYDPMGSLLKNSGVKLLRGYCMGNVPKDVSLVVIGNAVSRDHIEVKVVAERKIPFTCFPSLMFDLVIKGRHSIVAAGTHGKSTTASLLIHALSKLNLNPSFFVGGMPIGYKTGLKCTSGGFSVVEGDEYDSAFFAKTPKFSFYKPDSCLITSIEFDHADIYRDLKDITAQFDNLVESIPADGLVVCCSDCLNLRERINHWKTLAACRIKTYGTAEDADYKIISFVQKGRTASIEIEVEGSEFATVNAPVIGMHNAKNIAGALTLINCAGLNTNSDSSLFEGWRGIKRRQEVRFEKEGIVVLDDFAHHPTAVAETLKAVRAAYPKSRLWAVFEPRSYTSRRNLFYDDYAKAFKDADKAVLCTPTPAGIDKDDELLDVEQLSGTISKRGTEAAFFSDPIKIKDYLLRCADTGDVFLIMSNGGFGGLVNELVKELEAR